MLVQDHRILCQVADSRIIDNRSVKKNPSDVSVEKSTFDIVRVAVSVRVTMMPAMKRRPTHRRLFKRGPAKNQHQEANWPSRSKGRVREKAMIAKRDRERAGQRIKREKGNIVLGQAISPEINWARNESRHSDDAEEGDGSPAILALAQ